MSGRTNKPAPPPTQLPPPKTRVSKVDDPDDPDNPENQPPSPQKSLEDAEAKLQAWQVERQQAITTQLADYTDRQVTHLLWVCDGDPCPECLMNNHEIVVAGNPFPNGAKLPPVHPNCMCTIVGLSTAQFGLDSQELELEDKDEISDMLKKYVK